MKSITDHGTANRTLPRYSVTKTTGNKDVLVDFGDDLDALQRKHGPGLPVQLPLFSDEVDDEPRTA